MSTPASVLVYRLGSLGDTIIALPCFHLIRRVFSRSKIIILTNHPISGKAAPAMAILENSGLCDDAVSYPLATRNTNQLVQLRRTIQELRTRVVINLASARGLAKSLRDYLFFRSCGINQIIGTPLRRRDLRVQKTESGEYEAESQRLASRLVSLGGIDLADRRLWNLGLTREEHDQALELLPSSNGELLAASVGTKLPVKDWGEENWEQLLRRLSGKMPGICLILLGSADEWERSERLRGVWAGDCTNLCGKTSPRISAAVLERCRLFIGHDSGPMHLASAVGVPTLALFSWFNPPGQWFPGHKSWEFVKVLYPALPAGGWKPELQMKQSALEGIRRLRPEDAFEAAMSLWQRAVAIARS